MCTYVHTYLCMHIVCVFLYMFPNLICCTISPAASPTVTVLPVESMSDYQNGSEISLRCSWDTSVYYVAWYKNGVLIYEEDLAASSVLMGPPQGISVDSGYTTMMSTLTITSAVLDDSGNYTCAVTCGAKGAEFGMIEENLTDTAEVFVYGELYGVKCCILSHNAMRWYQCPVPLLFGL